MNKFNLEDYETVKSRKKKFYEKYSDGRIIVKHLEVNDSHALFMALGYKDKEDQANSLPCATGYAQEFKGQGSFANKTSWTENCEESAIGRMLDNAGFSSNNRCSKEEMGKVVRDSQPSSPHSARTSEVVHPAPLNSTSGMQIQQNDNEYGKYEIPFGKYKGMKVSDVDEEKLRDYCNWLLNKAKGKIHPSRDDVVAAAKGFYGFELC